MLETMTNRPIRTIVAPMSFGTRLSFTKDDFELPFLGLAFAVKAVFLFFRTNIDIAMSVLLSWDDAQI